MYRMDSAYWGPSEPISRLDPFDRSVGWNEYWEHIDRAQLVIRTSQEDSHQEPIGISRPTVDIAALIAIQPHERWYD